MTLLPPLADAYASSESLLNWMAVHAERHGAVFRSMVYGRIVYVVTDPVYAEHVLRRNWQNYRKGLAIKRVALLLGSGLMVSEGDLWKTQRRMIQPAFHQNLLGNLLQIIVAANTTLLRKWEAAAKTGDRVDVTHDISLMIMEIVLRSIFGDDYDHVAASFSILSDDTARDMRFAQGFRSLKPLIVEVANRRRHRASPDLLGMMVEARDRDSGEAMSEGQLVNEILTLIVAGHETTASTLNWVWFLLSQHPEVETKLHDEVGDAPAFAGVEDVRAYRYAGHVVEEALRLFPAGWLMTRRALGDDQIGEYFVPAGAEVYVPTYLIQRHPHLWDEPDRFNPERFETAQPTRHPLAMLPFSAGPRNCIGEHMARLEMHAHVVLFASKLRLRYVADRPLDLDLGVNLRNKYNFIMLPTLLDHCC